jgi:AcrR family transcriptional regulator
VSPRAYHLGRRQASSEETRQRVLAAARALLAAEGTVGFTVDAVAERADVARMTIYYQFESKRGLLDELFDDLSARGLVDRLRATLGRAEPFEALGEFIGAFAGFWSSDRVVIRRLRGLAALDPEVDDGLRARDGHRLAGLRAIVARIAEKHGRPSAQAMDEAVDVLHALTSFETFDALAGHARTPEDVAMMLIRAAHAVLGLG